MTADTNARETLRQLVTGFRLTHLVIAAADLGLADYLIDGPRSSAELAALVGAVGGGNGSLLVAVLQRYPGPRGIVFDLAHAGEAARSNVEVAGVSGRCEFVAGSFFESIPSGADAYLMRWILHDWDDQQSIAILQTCRRAMAPGSKLIVIERLLPDGNNLDLEALIADINMLVQVGGRERTVAEFTALFEAADLRLERVVPTGTIFHMLVAVSA